MNTVWCRMHVEEKWSKSSVEGQDFSYHYVVEAVDDKPPADDYIPTDEEDNAVRLKLGITH